MGAIKFAAWTDLHENAFTISIPERWKAVGGAYRLSATDVRIGVVLGPPDGQMRFCWVIPTWERSLSRIR
jgi:hypothetical protein